MIWLKGKQLSPVADSFLKYINTEKTKIIKQYFDQPGEE
jgi:hypothetical protein